MAMAERAVEPGTTFDRTANHLCVLVHGLWGNSDHLNYICQSLRDKYDEDELVILPCKKNASFFTYDGIEVGGERVAKEIEDTLEDLNRKGHNITRFSIVGYSLGGLFARYAVGLLDNKGYFDHMKPISFTTFASPHLGVRTPSLGYTSQIWNTLGARTLSASGRQLFGVDDFRDTSRPLLDVLADPDSIFINALAKFESRCLYANIVNDRTAVFYTTGISKIDPFVDLDQLKLRYVEGYEPVILDSERPYDTVQDDISPSYFEVFKGTSRKYLQRTPIFAALAILLPIGIVAFMINSSVQTVRSQRRITLHEQDQEGHGFGVYKIPLLRKVRAGLEDAYEITNSARQQDYLPEDSAEAIKVPQSFHTTFSSSSRGCSTSEKSEAGVVTAGDQSGDQSSCFPTLALTKNQFAMIDSLDKVGFRKYGVHIHKTSHSHAAMIVRSSRGAFEDGKTVIRHWLEREFRI